MLEEKAGNRRFESLRASVYKSKFFSAHYFNLGMLEEKDLPLDRFFQDVDRIIREDLCARREIL